MSYLNELKCDAEFNFVYSKESFLMNLNENICIKTEEEGLSLKDIADKLQLSLSDFNSKLESEFTLTELFVISFELNCKGDDLLMLS